MRIKTLRRFIKGDYSVKIISSNDFRLFMEKIMKNKIMTDEKDIRYFNNGDYILFGGSACLDSYKNKKSFIGNMWGNADKAISIKEFLLLEDFRGVK